MHASQAVGPMRHRYADWRLASGIAPRRRAALGLARGAFSPRVYLVPSARMSRKYLLAAVAVAAVAVIGYLAWLSRNTHKLPIQGVAVGANGSLAISVVLPAGASYAGWVGSKLVVHAKSLGKATATTVASVVPGSPLIPLQGGVITSAPIAALASGWSYTADSGDYVRVYAK